MHGTGWHGLDTCSGCLIGTADARQRSGTFSSILSPSNLSEDKHTVCAHMSQSVWVCLHVQGATKKEGRQTDLLGTRLMALRGLRTRTVRIADKLIFWRSKEYSTILPKERERMRSDAESERGV